MTTPRDEQISALVDDELDAAEAQQGVSSLLQDTELLDRWGHYHLISDAIRNNLPARVDDQFASRVMAAIDQEPTVLAPPRKPAARSSGLGQKVAGLAIAASVAAVAVLGVQTLYREDPSAPLAAAQQMAQAPVRAPVVQVAASAGTQGNVNIPAHIPPHFDARLHKYLVNHSQLAAQGGIQGAIPYARFVAYPDVRRSQPRQ